VARIRQLPSLRELHLHEHTTTTPLDLLVELRSCTRIVGSIFFAEQPLRSTRGSPWTDERGPAEAAFAGRCGPSIFLVIPCTTHQPDTRFCGGWDLPQGETTVGQFAALARALRSCSMLKELRMEHWKTQLLAHFSDAELF
jgi:hypothetical protein